MQRRLGSVRGTGPRATGAGARVFFRCLARDRPSRYGGRGAFFSSCGGRHAYTNAMQVFLHRLLCPRDRSLILAILIILAILLQSIDIKVLRTFSRCYCCGSIDIKVFQTFAPFAASSCSSCSSCASWPSCFRRNAREGQAPARWAPQNSTGPIGPECL